MQVRILFIVVASLLMSAVHQQVQAQSTDNPAVYITKTGERYHKETCHHLARSKIKTTLIEAKEDGYTPCKVCKPVGYKPSSPPPSTKAATVRCSALTQAGARCKRMTKNANGRCYQHQ